MTFGADVRMLILLLSVLFSKTFGRLGKFPILLTADLAELKPILWQRSFRKRQPAEGESPEE